MHRAFSCVWVLSFLVACTEVQEAIDTATAWSDTAKPTSPVLAPPAWYDATPLLASLRPSMHEPFKQAIAPLSPSQLPLYDMALDVDLGSAHFDLKQMVWWTNTDAEAMPDLAFRVYANTAATLQGKEAPVRLIKGTCPEDTACVIEQATPDLITVKPSRPILAGERFRVALHVDGKLTRIDSGRTNMLAQGLESMASMGSPHGHGDYGLLAIGDGVASLANFYPMLAPRRHGRWIRGEENLLGDLGSDDLCHVRAMVTVDPGVELIAAGHITERQRADSGRSRIHLVAGAVREMALLASRQLRSATVRVDDIAITSHYLANDAAAGMRALDIAKSALQIFQRRFGEYPYTELDVVEAAMVGGAGGVEFSGLVTVASMLYRPMTGGPGGGGGPGGSTGLAALLGRMNPQGNAAGEQLREAMFEFVVAHEVAHQYWHVLVGSDSREHPFNDEALAQHSAVVYLEDRYGQERARRDEDMQVINGYRMMRSLGHADGAVDQPVAAFGSPLEYAGLIYGKGPMVYRALRDQTGEDGFFEAVRIYVKTYRFKTAPRRALIETIASRGRAVQVQKIATHWLGELHGDEDLGTRTSDLNSTSGTTTAGGPTPETSIPGAGGSDMAQAMELLQGLSGGDTGSGTNNGSKRLGYGTGLRGSGMFDSNGVGSGNNGSNGTDPEMQELMKTLPGGGQNGTPDLGQLLQQMQQMQQPHAP